MAGFLGSFEYSVDAKGRVNIPAKFRKALSPEAEETFFITHGPGNCLRVFPKDVWDKRMAKFAALPATEANDNFRRFISSTSSESVLDVQGRIMLTAAQMKYAQITKDIMIIGDMKGYIELWDPAKYMELIGSIQDVDTLIYAVEDQLTKMEQSAQI